jgi:IS30 family transposase
MSYLIGQWALVGNRFRQYFDVDFSAFTTDRQPFSSIKMEADIQDLLKKGISKSAIARILGVHRLTVSKCVREGFFSGDKEWLDSVNVEKQGAYESLCSKIKSTKKKREKKMRKEINNKMKIK